jgi:ATP-dependent protease HslVU (ClpYQ) peptidase subunit
MSLIIAVKHDNIIYMGADTQTTAGTARVNGINKKRYKIKTYEQGVLLGVSGRLTNSAHLYLHDEWFNIPQDEKLTHAYILNNIVNPFYKELEALKKLGKNYDDTKSFGCSLIIAKDDKMFKIEQSGAILEIPYFVAIGSGSEYVYPFFRYPMPGKPVDKMLQALKITSIYEPTVHAPYVLIDSKHLTFNIIEGENS